MSTEKIGPQHRARKAVLYVRQSSAHQVQHNREIQVVDRRGVLDAELKQRQWFTDQIGVESRRRVTPQSWWRCREEPGP